MNTATSVSPTSTLEINNLFGEKETDYPAQASRSSVDDVTRNNSGYRRLTIREKLAKQRSEKEKDDCSTSEARRLTKTTSLRDASATATNFYQPTVRSQSEEPRRLTKTTSVGNAQTAPTNTHRPTTRSQSNSSITEEKTVFGFKIMKGLPGSTDLRDNNSAASTRRGTSRQPGRITNYSTVNRFRDKTGNTLFYTPKNNRTSETTKTSEETTEPTKIAENLKDKGSSFSSDEKVDMMAKQSSIDMDKKLSDTVEKLNKDSSNMAHTTVLNIGSKGARNTYVIDASKKSGKPRNIDTKDVSENYNDERPKLSKEIEVQNEEGKTEKLLVRAESLREGKSRLEEFREKQRRGKLSRSLTNPDFQQSENMTSSKGKNISESLAEIRERIRERRRKKGLLKKSQSMPETESPPRQDGEESTKEFSHDTRNNLGKPKEGELDKKGNKMSEEGNDSNLNKSEYLEIEEISKMNDNVKNQNMTVVSRTCEDMVMKDKIEEEVMRTNNNEENTKLQDTKNNEVIVMDAGKQMDKDDSDGNGSDEVISEGKKIKLKEILSNKKDEDQKHDDSPTDGKTDGEKSVSNIVSNSEKTKTEVKKPTKRERRKRQERYQRSKTMSAIMYNEISLEARREMLHKGDDGKSGDKNGESLALPSVSEIKKRFLEADAGSSKMSDLGLFYSGKTAASSKSSGVVKLSSRNKTMEKASVKDDSATGKATKSEARSRKNYSRRHTVAIGTTLTQDKNVNNDSIGMNNQNIEPLKTDKRQTTETKAKVALDRRHTLPSYTTEISVQCNNNHSSVNHSQKNVAKNGGRLPVRRHTFCTETSFMVSRHQSVKVPDSVEKLRERFSKGAAPVFHLATSNNDCSNKAGGDIDSNERSLKRVVSDSTVKRIIEEAKTLKDVNKERGSSLRRRHTIATRSKSEDFENDEQERNEFQDKFLAKDDEIEKSQKSEEKTITNDVESKTVELSQSSKPTEKDKEEKLSGLKLRNSFVGQKKTKLRDRRAKTIGGTVSSDIVEELNVKNKDDNKKYVDLYVNNATLKEEKEDKTEKRRRSSDLNPDSYLSSEPLSSEETGKDSVFCDDKPSHGNAQAENILSNVKTSEELTTRQPALTRRRSVSDSDMKIASGVSVNEQKFSQNQVQFPSDVIDLKTPTETNLSALDHARRRSGSESDLSRAQNVSGKDQNLDDYLTTAIKTLTESPKSQKTSPRGSPQKGAFTASRDESEERHETKRHLHVVKSNLSMHSWSTSDLDKIMHGGDAVRPSASQVDMSTMDFDEISSSTTRLQSLTEGRAKVGRPKRTSSKSLNPMKSLMERTDVRTHTEPPEEENKSASGFEKAKKRSNPRKKRSQLEPWRRHTLDPVALAALASREDFSRVSLRRTKGPGKEKDEYDGSLPVMLIQIKGRRQVQTRLVEPSLSSLNAGDCFILVTKKELFCWIGKHANTIEKAKAVEISTKIQKRGDMNCKTGDVLYIDETKQGNTLAYKKFCKILEGEADFPIEDAQMCPDDEFYEREVISTNKVYKLQEGDPPHLIPVTEQCGYMPRIGILNTKEVFVFDFGSELYVWTGQQSLSNKRKVAFHLAEMLYKQQFDCRDGVISPIDPRRAMKRSQSSQPEYHDAEGKKCGRPTWTLFAKLHEKAETLLFQEKFFDWPDPTKIIRMKGHISSGEVPERLPPVELKPCDPTVMQKPASDLEPAILEATNLGRGLGTPNIEVNGEVKEGDLVTTLGMTVWLVTQNKHFVLPKSSEGHFHSGDGYVIRWVYFVAKNRTVRDRRGRIRPLTGRQRCAYFFWQGNDCSVNEKGAAAIVAVELDEEHGPQIRVVEGKEPPHFLKLFDGAMVIHSGKRIRVSDEQDEFSDKSTVRMYCIRNEDISEGCLIQVKRSASSLRSRSSFVVVDSEKGNVFVWHGCKTSEYHRKSAEKAANFIKEKHPIEMNLSEEVSLSVTEIEEGSESDIFWSTVSGKKDSHLSLLNDPLSYDFCPRLFHLTSATGQFTSTEILSPSRYPGRTCLFPVVQDDLYSASQPVAFLLDVGDELYIWEGWMPTEITKDKRGSAKRRWDEERKLALQTSFAYIEEANGRITKGAYVVQAGLEPSCFTTHFPFWNRKQSIAEIKRKEGKKDGEKKPIEEALDTLTKKSYSFQELTSDNPPDGVDPSKLETYLTDEEFEKIFEMTRDLFGLLPGWKQDILKKAFGLF